MFKKLLASLITGSTLPKSPLPAPHTTPSPVVTPAVNRTGPKIVFINHSSVLSEVQLQQAVAALQIQLDRDFAPVWETNATLSWISASITPPPDAWQIIVKDTSPTNDGTLGYHDLTPQGNPVGYIFAKDDINDGLSWSVTLSHELLEMLVDPYIANVTFVQISNTSGRLFAYEVCDAVEDDIYGYLINGIRVSDFVYPAWFEGFRAPGSTRFSQSQKVTAPFQLLPGGYISVFDVASSLTGWTQITADGKPGRRLLAKPPTSRKNRRNEIDE